MPSSLSTTINRLHRVRRETTSYLASLVHDHRTHEWALRRMKAVRDSEDFRRLPRWAQDRISGYEEAYFDAIANHLLEWRLRRISDGEYIRSEDVNWGEREVDGGAHFWKGTDMRY